MKKKVILIGTHGKPSSREAFLNCNTGSLLQRRRFTSTKGKLVHYYREYTQGNKESYNKLKPQLPLNMEDTVSIRWGTQEPIITNGNSIIYNKLEGLRNATNKGLARVLMSQAGVRVPKIVTPDNVKEKHLPIICRPMVHSKGKNFIILKTIEEFTNHYNPQSFYYSRFIDKELEFRVHCGHGKVLRLMKKHNPGEGQIAWNRAVNKDAPGFERVRWSESEPYIDVMRQALHAVEALELDMGGVDVMFKNGKAYVLEVNTAPTLNSCPTTAKKWGRYWNWLLASDKRRPVFNWREWTKGKSFFIKNFQLDE